MPFRGRSNSFPVGNLLGAGQGDLVNGGATMNLSAKRMDFCSIAAFEQAKKVIPGGVNSPVRAFSTVDLPPVFAARGQGARVFDIDGNEFIDYIGSWGPLILGHAHPEVVEAIREAAFYGTSFGMSTEIEIKMAEWICRSMPSIEMVRMVNSGTFIEGFTR